MTSDTAQAGLGPASLLRFYTPLAATSMLMMVTHSVVAGAVARTPDPVVALAAYSAAFSVGQVFESPCYRMQQMGLVFVRGTESFRVVSRVAVQIVAVLALCLAAVGWTPLAVWVFSDLLGAPAQLLGPSTAALRLLVLWPIASTLRALYQVRIVLNRRTLWLTVNMLVRVAAMMGVAVVLPRFWGHGPVGAAILMTGLGVEAALAWFVARLLLPPLGPDPHEAPVVPGWQVLRFFLPLAAAASLQTLGRPVVTAALARTASPSVALSGYHVAFSFALIFAVPMHTVYQVVLVFVRDPASCRRIRAFVLALGAAASALLSACALPLPGRWVFGTLIGVPPAVTAEALKSLALLGLLPLAIANSEFFAALLLLSRRTVWVTVSKLGHVLVMSGLALALAHAYPGLGAVSGALALVVGALVEAALCYTLVRRFPDTRFLLVGQAAPAGGNIPW